jgi:hypothetical protein
VEAPKTLVFGAYWLELTAKRPSAWRLLLSGLYRRPRSCTGSCAIALAGFTADRELGLSTLTLPRRLPYLVESIIPRIVPRPRCLDDVSLSIGHRRAASSAYRGMSASDQASEAGLSDRSPRQVSSSLPSPVQRTAAMDAGRDRPLALVEPGLTHSEPCGPPRAGLLGQADLETDLPFDPGRWRAAEPEARPLIPRAHKRRQPGNPVTASTTARSATNRAVAAMPDAGLSCSDPPDRGDLNPSRAAVQRGPCCACESSSLPAQTFSSRMSPVRRKTNRSAMLVTWSAIRSRLCAHHSR